MSFKEKGYQIIRNAISPELAQFCHRYFILKAKVFSKMLEKRTISPYLNFMGTFNDPQVPNSYAHYADIVMETLLIDMQKKMQDETGLNLIPTYSYARIYYKGNALTRHKDRPSCEVSTTLCLGYDNQNLKGRKKDWEKYNWPMWVDKTGGANNKGVPIHLEPGDMIVYRGVIIEHWREPFLGKNHAQVFLHYNDTDGPFKDTCVYDCRPMFGLPDQFKDPKRVEKMNMIDIEESKKYKEQLNSNE